MRTCRIRSPTILPSTGKLSFKTEVENPMPKWKYLLREDDLDDIFTVLAKLLLLALVLV